MGSGGSNDPREIYLGVKHCILTPPPDFSGKILSGTNPHVVIEATFIIIIYSETRSNSVFLLSFITDLWTPRNVALLILTSQSKNSSRAPALAPG